MMENKKDMNIVVSVVICLALAGVLIFISLNKKENMNSNNVTADNTSATTAGVAKSGDKVGVDYTGRLQDGTERGKSSGRQISAQGQRREGH